MITHGPITGSISPYCFQWSGASRKSILMDGKMLPSMLPLSRLEHNDMTPQHAVKGPLGTSNINKTQSDACTHVRECMPINVLVRWPPKRHTVSGVVFHYVVKRLFKFSFFNGNHFNEFMFCRNHSPFYEVNLWNLQSEIGDLPTHLYCPFSRVPRFPKRKSQVPLLMQHSQCQPACSCFLIPGASP